MTGFETNCCSAATCGGNLAKLWPYALTLTPEANTTLWNAATRDLHCLPFNNAGDRGAPFKLQMNWEKH